MINTLTLVGRIAKDLEITENENGKILKILLAVFFNGRKNTLIIMN